MLFALFFSLFFSPFVLSFFGSLTLLSLFGALPNISVYLQLQPTMESTMSNDVLLVSPETQFARILEEFQLGGGRSDPFDVIRSFTLVAASRAVAVGQKMAEFGESEADKSEFASWDLEAKMWHLVRVLYLFRLSDHQTIHPLEYSSQAVKSAAYLTRNAKIKEILLIIEWLQFNLQEVSADVSLQAAKWTNTKIGIESRNLSTLAPQAQMVDYVECLDADAPLRTPKQISPIDKHVDDGNFAVIYRMVLSGDVQKAIDYASETGNFTIALILMGSQQDYFDPVLDDSDAMDHDDDQQEEPSGIQHKYLWFQTVARLAQEPALTQHEKLIYSFLCGGDQSENIAEAGSNWEECLLVYLNELYKHHTRTFLKTLVGPDDQTPLVSFPTPSHTSVDGILNLLLKAPATQSESASALRVIVGSVMINQLSLFLHNTFKTNRTDLLEDPYVLRILAHLAVVMLILDLHEGSATPTKLLTTYISMLSKQGDEDIVPVYLAFIPDEKDVRECYSIFLSTITDPQSRARQLDLFRRLGVNTPGENTPNSTSTEEVGYEYENKINNVLKRTVERVMAETEAAYDPQGEIKVEDKVVAQTDVTLYRSVEWLFENKMYEDAITASRTIIRRFLLTGRLKSILEFCNNKTFKALLKDYDLDLHTRSMGDVTPPTLISEDDKEELMQYEQLVEALRILHEWRAFAHEADVDSRSFWTSKDVEKSIEKTIHKLHDLVFRWFVQPIATCTQQDRVDIYKEYRSIYVPYFIIELLQVLQQSRHKDWKYMQQAFQLVNAVANDKQYDFLQCFVTCGRLGEFVTLAGDVALVASENKQGIA